MIESTNKDITICLVMIVRDEEDTIQKCLQAVAPYIKYWVIVDTGSKDMTISVINQTMASLQIPGELHQREWVNFAVNRTESLNLAKNKCDFRFIIDADDVFSPVDKTINPFADLSKDVDCYQILYKLGTLHYYRHQLVKSSGNWCYKGVLHEYLHTDDANITYGQIEMAYVDANISPLKRAATLQEKYANDAKILELAIVDEPDNSRYMFYLAQSYRDSEQLQKSLTAYQKRRDMQGWDEEVYYSMYMIAKINEQLMTQTDTVLDMYLKAWEFRPCRLETVCSVMRILRQQNRFMLSCVIGASAVEYLEFALTDLLFVEIDVYQYKLLDEYSLALYYTGAAAKAAQITNNIIKSNFFKDIPQQEQTRLLTNAEFYNNGK